MSYEPPRVTYKAEYWTGRGAQTWWRVMGRSQYNSGGWTMHKAMGSGAEFECRVVATALQTEKDAEYELRQGSCDVTSQGVR